MTGLLPKSLVGQLLVLVAFTLLIAQGFNLLLLYRGAQTQNRIEASTTAMFRIAGELERMGDARYERRRERRERRDERSNRNRMRPLISNESALPEQVNRLNELEERAANIMQNRGFNVRSIEAALVEAVPENFKNSIVGIRPGSRLTRQMGRPMKSRRPIPKVTSYILMSAQIEDDRWISVASAVRDRGEHVFQRLLTQTVILYLILLIPLILLGKYISRPLKRLTVAAENFKPDMQQPVRESGPPDTRQLIGAFNQMNQRVSAMLDEKDIMLGAIGHDLRTPLAALRVRVENVEDDSERERMIAGIEDMDQMLDDILSLARLGRSGEEAEATDINALIETVTAEFSDIGDDVEFTRVGRKIANVRAVLIRRALRNLIGNAIKYGGEAVVSVDKTADNLLIHVDDKGPGIAETDIETMFEPFVRADASRNRSTGGSGLGLTLARAIARDHGGDINLENRSSGGLRATLILPD